MSAAGLAPVLALAERVVLHDLAGAHLRLPGAAGANPAGEVSSLVAGMAAGADSIDDMALLRHGAMGRLFDGVRAPSTLGTFLRAFTFGHVRQRDAIASRFLVNLAGQAPILRGSEAVAYVDVDDTVRMDPAVTTAITSIAEDAWTPIRYQAAVWDEAEGRWVSGAEAADVAEVPFTAFTSGAGPSTSPPG